MLDSVRGEQCFPEFDTGATMSAVLKSTRSSSFVPSRFCMSDKCLDHKGRRQRGREWNWGRISSTGSLFRCGGTFGMMFSLMLYLGLLPCLAMSGTTELRVPSFTQPPANSTAYLGLSMTISCVAAVGQRGTVIIRKDGVAKIRGNYTYPLSANSDGHEDVVKLLYTLDSVERGDAGMYTCHAATHARKVINSSAHVRVEEPRRPVVERLSNRSIQFGKAAEIVCKFSGAPDPIVYWSLPQRLQSLSKDHGVYDNGQGVLTIHNMTEDHQGWYRCHAQNALSSSVQKVYLKGKNDDDGDDDEEDGLPTVLPCMVEPNAPHCQPPTQEDDPDDNAKDQISLPVFVALVVGFGSATFFFLGVIIVVLIKLNRDRRKSAVLPIRTVPVPERRASMGTPWKWQNGKSGPPHSRPQSDILRTENYAAQSQAGQQNGPTSAVDV